MFKVLKATARRRESFHKYVQRLYRFDLRHIPGVKYLEENKEGEHFDRPVMVVSNHQSMLDSAVFLALSHRLVIISNHHPSRNKVVKHIYRWLDCVVLSEDMNENLRVLRERIQQGYSLVVFPEGERNSKSSIMRFHKGAFYIAEQLGLDIVPVFLHGLNEVLPRNSRVVYQGQISVFVRRRILLADTTWGNGYAERTKSIHRYYIKEYAKIASKIENKQYYKYLVRDRYRYKGTEIYNVVKKSLKKELSFEEMILSRTEEKVVMENRSYGELPLLYAFTHPDKEVIVVEPDVEKRALLRYSAEGVASNLKVCDNLNKIDVL